MPPTPRAMSQGCPEDRAAAQPAEVELAVALQVSRELKSRRRSSSKASITKAQPLKVAREEPSGPSGGRTFRHAWRQTAGELSEADQRKAVRQALEVFRLLPPSSSYAQHRIRVLEKALQLLDKGGR